jgi:hypothetical protein
LLALVCAGCATGETGTTVVLSASGATVNGRVASTVGGPVEYWVQYGETTAYGSETAHQTVDLPPNTPRTVFVAIGGLARETQYHYRVCASDSEQGSAGPGCGVDRTFVTESALCGRPVTTSIRLTTDVICNIEDGPALIVGADGIDINLAGHRLGVTLVSGGGGTAITNAGHSDVTIRNGAAIGAIEIEGASRNVIRDVGVTSAGTAIHIEGGEANEVRASTVIGRGSGIVVSGPDAVVANNDATATLGHGILVTGDRARIVRNRVPAEQASVQSGMELRGSDGRIVDNRVTGGWLAGGLVLASGAGNVIAENEVSDVAESTPGGPDNPFGDGIVVSAATAGTLLRNNLSQRNDGDGFDIRATDARLRANSAFDNRLLGINAVAGVTDLGGNRARGNGNPLQCLNVVCSP